MTKALIVDDHPIVLDACKRALQGAGIIDVSEASSVVDGFRLYRKVKPDIIVTDLSMHTGVLGGMSFIRRLRIHDKATPILVFSMHSDPLIVFRTLEAGATGYLWKATNSDEFIRAFHKVRGGVRYISHEIASELAFTEVRGAVNPLRMLTLREWQTLSLIAVGKSYGAIADELHVSYKTVANTAAHIKTKLGARTLPELVRIGIAHLPS